MKKIVVAIIGEFLFVLGLTSFGYPSTNLSYRPQVRLYNKIPYMSGGFGLEERETLRAMGKKDNLELSFALGNRDYLGGAKVLIKDEKGKRVLEAVSDGPLFFAKLPAGDYTILATSMNRTIRQKAHVSGNGHTRLYYAWKESTYKVASHALPGKVSSASHHG